MIHQPVITGPGRHDSGMPERRRRSLRQVQLRVLLRVHQRCILQADNLIARRIVSVGREVALALRCHLQLGYFFAALIVVKIAVCARCGIAVVGVCILSMLSLFDDGTKGIAPHVSDFSLSERDPVLPDQCGRFGEFDDISGGVVIGLQRAVGTVIIGAQQFTQCAHGARTSSKGRQIDGRSHPNTLALLTKGITHNVRDIA